MIVGIATGLGAALLQSLSYLATRLLRAWARGKWARQLLVLGACLDGHCFGDSALDCLARAWVFGAANLGAGGAQMVLFFLPGGADVDDAGACSRWKRAAFRRCKG